jgi:hypothetical protein
VYTNTSGGSLTIEQSGAGNTYVNHDGTAAVGTVGMTDGTAVIKNVDGTVRLTANGSNGTVYASVSAGNLNIAQIGSGSILVNSTGNTSNLAPGVFNGDVTINNAGLSNIVKKLS